MYYQIAQREGDRLVTDDLIRKQIAGAIQLTGIEPKNEAERELLAVRIKQAVNSINHIISRTKPEGKRDAWYEAIVSIPKKMAANLAWISALNISPSKFGWLALTNVNLLVLNPDTNKKKFHNKCAVVESYGITKERLAKAGASHDSFFQQSDRIFSRHFWGLVETVRPYKGTPEQVAACISGCIQVVIQNTARVKKYFEQNTAFFFKYGISSEIFANAALKHGALFYLKPETLKDNFMKSAEGVERYGVSAENWAVRYFRRPRQLTSDANGQVRAFEMALALALSPFYKVRGGDRLGTYFERHVRIVTRMPPMSVNQVLLRMAFAEIVRPAPSAKVLRLSGCEVEAGLVGALAQEGSRRTSSVAPEESDWLRMDLDRLADDIVKELRARQPLDGPVPFARPILPVLYPEGKGEAPTTVRHKQLVLDRLRAAGLMKQEK